MLPVRRLGEFMLTMRAEMSESNPSQTVEDLDSSCKLSQDLARIPLCSIRPSSSGSAHQFARVT